MLKYMVIILSFTVLLTGQMVRKTGNLILENVPEIPAQVQERTRQYSNVRSAAFTSWDPGGPGMLIATRFAETTQLHYVENPLGIRRQITFFDEPVGGGLFCPKAGERSFLFTRDVGGNENYQIYAYNLQTGTSRLLTDGESRHGLGPWSRSGERFAFTSNRANGTDMQVWVGSLEAATARQVVFEPGYWIALDWSPDGSRLLVMRYVSINESYIYVVDLTDNRLEQLNPSGQRISYGDAAFSRDGNGVYLTSDEGSEFRHLRYLDLRSGTQQTLTGGIPWDVSGFTLTDDGRTLAYVTNEEGLSRLHLVRTRGFRPLPVPGLPLGRISSLKFHPDNRRLAMVFNTPRTPGDTYVYDLRSRNLVRWTESEVGGLDPEGFAVPNLIRVRAFDNLSIPAFIYRPRGQGPHPVVIYIHGGPESQYTPNFSSTFQYWINELGLAVLVPNVRGSSGYGKTYLQLDNGFNRENSVKDIGAFLDWIATQPDLNSERVAVFGGSYGGYMVLASMVHFNDRLRAAVDVVGISNFVTFLENTRSYRRDLRRAEYGDERDPAMRAFLEDISPTRNARRITKPLFIVQGYNDPRVPVTEAEQMRDRIRANGGDVWYLLAMDEGHGFRKKFNRDMYTNAVSLFWEQYLLK